MEKIHTNHITEIRKFSKQQKLPQNIKLRVYCALRMWGTSSWSESTEWWDRKSEDPTSGRGSFWERSSFGSWFSTSVFCHVSEMVPECVRTYGFKKNSSRLDRGTKMRDFVLLNSRDNLLVTLPSISTETRIMYSWFVTETDVFRDWPFLGCSFWFSLATAANILLFLKAAVFWREKENGGEDWNTFIFWSN